MPFGEFVPVWASFAFTDSLVNLEFDMIGKYVERFVLDRGPAKDKGGESGGGIDMALLAKSGFI